MKLRHTITVLFLLIASSASLAADLSPTSNSEYLIQPGDVLRIMVWKEESLDREVTVRPDGALSFPLINDIQAAGKSIATLRQLITDQLSQFIPDPSVTISTQQLQGNKIYVIGKVARSGEFPINRYVDVVQALSMAGGMTTYAAVNKIRILRRSHNGNLEAIPFQYGDIEKGENLEQNIVLQAGDVVLVP